MKNFFTTFILIFLGYSCEYSPKNYFPKTAGLKWVYSVVLESSYTGKSHNKRVMITNFSSKKEGNLTKLSRLYSDGSFYSYDIDEKSVTRTSVIFAFSEGIDEPVKKIIYPDLYFKQKEWIVTEQLFLVKGYQPPLLNVRPRSQVDMKYSIGRKYKEFKLQDFVFKDCIEVIGKGSTDFIGDTRSGPINVDVKNVEVLCNDVGLIKQTRYENTNASAFGNMKLEKKLMSFN